MGAIKDTNGHTTGGGKEMLHVLEETAYGAKVAWVDGKKAWLLLEMWCGIGGTGGGGWIMMSLIVIIVIIIVTVRVCREKK